jgi:acyl carrier protein
LGTIESVDENALLAKDIGLDSLGMVTLLVMLEDEFRIELNESDMNPFDLLTVGDVIRLVEKYMEVENE